MVSGMMENIALVLWGFGGILTEVFRATQNCTLIVNQMINDINIVLVTELICYKKQKHGFCFYCLTCDYVVLHSMPYSARRARSCWPCNITIRS